MLKASLKTAHATNASRQSRYNNLNRFQFIPISRCMSCWRLLVHIQESVCSCAATNVEWVENDWTDVWMLDAICSHRKSQQRGNCARQMETGRIEWEGCRENCIQMHEFCQWRQLHWYARAGAIAVLGRSIQKDQSWSILTLPYETIRTIMIHKYIPM